MKTNDSMSRIIAQHLLPL